MKNNNLFFIVLTLIIFALFINMGSYGVVETSDARYAEIGREMLVDSDYIHPNLLKVHHYHKPPFTYQITAFGYKIFGVNSFGARFFLQISVIIQVYLVYLIGLLLFKEKRTALYASIIYFSFPLVLISSRNLTTDSFLTTFALLSIYSWLKYRLKNDFRFLYLTAISLGLGFYTKGPVIFIIPVIFMVTYSLVNKQKKKFTIHHLFATILFLIIASWWFLLLVNENPDFTGYFLGKQTVSRFSKNVFNRTEPFWYFFAFAPAVGAPWLLLLPYLLKVKKDKIKKNKLIKILLISVTIPLLFFSISSSKRILYILPFYSILAILTAFLISKLKEKQIKKITVFVLGYSVLVLFVLLIAPFLKIDFTFPLITSVTSLFTIVLLIWIYKSKKISFKDKPFAISLVFSLFLIISASYLMSKNQLKINSSKPVTDFLQEQKLNDKNIFIYNIRKPSIAFQLNKPVISIYNGDRSLNRETQFEQDLNFKNYLYNLKDKNEKNILFKKLQKSSVLLVYKPVTNDTSLKELTNYFKNKKQFENWVVYY